MYIVLIDSEAYKLIKIISLLKLKVKKKFKYAIEMLRNNKNYTHLFRPRHDIMQDFF